MTLTSPRIEPLLGNDPAGLLAAVLADHHEFWDGRDLRALHHPMWFRQFADAGLVAWQTGGGGRQRVVGYLLGAVTHGGLGYVHLIAVRSTHRRRGLGRTLWSRFVGSASLADAREVQAITTPGNRDSIAFHTGLGLTAELIRDYAGPGLDRVLFHARLQPSGTNSANGEPSRRASPARPQVGPPSTAIATTAPPSPHEQPCSPRDLPHLARPSHVFPRDSPARGRGGIRVD